MARLWPRLRWRSLTVIVCAFFTLWLSACGGADDTQEYERRIEGILEPITALNREIATSINALRGVEGDGQVETGGVALINLRNASVALEMEARQAVQLLGEMGVPSQCQGFHDLVTSAMNEFEQMGAEYAQGADIFADGRGSELIDVPALERGGAHLLAAQEELTEAAGTPADECSG